MNICVFGASSDAIDPAYFAAAEALGACIARGAHLKDCIVMRGCTVEKGADLRYVIADKDTTFSEGTVLAGNDKLPLVVPKGTSI